MIRIFLCWGISRICRISVIAKMIYTYAVVIFVIQFTLIYFLIFDRHWIYNTDRLSYVDKIKYLLHTHKNSNEQCESPNL